MQHYGKSIAGASIAALARMEHPCGASFAESTSRLTPLPHLAASHLSQTSNLCKNKQDADKWLSEIHLKRDHPALRKFVRRHDADAHDEMWSLDKTKSYIPTIVIWSLYFLYVWSNSNIVKKNLLYIAFSVEHMGTVIHVFVDSSVVGLWHHVNTSN